MSNIYLKLTFEAFSKLRFSRFKKFATRSVCREPQLTQISLNFKTSSGNLKIRGLRAKMCVNVLNYDILKSKRPCILLNKNINFNKIEAEFKMESPTHGFRETKLVFQLI